MCPDRTIVDAVGVENREPADPALGLAPTLAFCVIIAFADAMTVSCVFASLGYREIVPWRDSCAAKTAACRRRTFAIIRGIFPYFFDALPRTTFSTYFRMSKLTQNIPSHREKKGDVV